MKTRITEILGIEYPVIQGGMAWVAEHNLAAAVSEAGGLGIIGAGGAPAEFVREQIRKVKEVTDKPFGVNLMLMNPEADAIAQVIVDEGVKVVTTGAGNPAKYMEMWKAAGVKVIPVVASVAMAKLMERGGADAVVAEGMESGGHIGSTTTMALVPQVVDAVNIPVIAAGGIADGRGFAAAFMLGAEAVQIGTRFVVATESIVHENYKAMLIKAKDIDSAVTGVGCHFLLLGIFLTQALNLGLLHWQADTLLLSTREAFRTVSKIMLIMVHPLCRYRGKWPYQSSYY